MFEGSEFPKSLNETVFNEWLENGRQSKIGYHYLLVIWDDYEAEYRAVYVERREEIGQYENHQSSVGRESLVAAYDLYSESRIL